MRSSIALVPAALLAISLIGCTDNDDDARSKQSTPQPTNQDRATTGGQPNASPGSVHDVRTPSVDARTSQAVPQPVQQDRAMNSGQQGSVHDVRTPSVDARTSQPMPQPVQQDRATNSGQQGSVHDVRTPSVDGRTSQPVPQPGNQDRATTGQVQMAPDAARRDANSQASRDRTALGRDAGTSMDRTDAPRPADNSGTNMRDRSGNTLTPFDQGSSEMDRDITQAVRKAVVDADDMSVNGQNVKIITLNGVVTLRGPVAHTEERNMIVNLAKRTAGVTRVDDQLEIAR